MNPGERLSDAFAHPAAGDARVESALRALLEKCTAKWPELTVDAASFLARVAECVPRDADLVVSLEKLHGADLYLAFGCAEGDKDAILAFEWHFLPDVASYVAQIDRSSSFVDDVRQGLRERLLVDDGERRAKISEYTGRGPLAAWLRVAAVRTALNLRRGVRREVSHAEEDSPHMRAPVLDPELDYLKTRYAKEFRDVFRVTLSSLPRDERTVLRLHYIDGLTLDQIAVAYHVHRSTAARWLASARERILEDTKRLLSKRLNASAKEVESLLAVVQSQLDVSIYNYLEDDDD